MKIIMMTTMIRILKDKIFYFLILLTISSYSQEKAKLIKVDGFTLIENTNDTVPLVTIEAFNNNKRIWTVNSDFNSHYTSIFCSNLLQSDTLIFLVTGIYCIQTSFTYIIKNDTSINLYLKNDPEKLMTFEKLKEYNKDKISFVDECIPSIDDKRYQNKKFKHYCTGEIKSFEEIIENDLGLSDWILIKE